MNLPKEKGPITPLDTRQMKVSPDGSTVTVGSQRFKRTVLPSVAAPQPDAELDVLDEEENTIGTDTAT